MGRRTLELGAGSTEAITIEASPLATIMVACQDCRGCLFAAGSEDAVNLAVAHASAQGHANLMLIEVFPPE
jgi:hypothetical protein